MICMACCALMDGVPCALWCALCIVYMAWCAFLHGVPFCNTLVRCPCAVPLCNVLVRYPGAMSLCGVFALMALIK